MFDCTIRNFRFNINHIWVAYIMRLLFSWIMSKALYKTTIMGKYGRIRFEDDTPWQPEAAELFGIGESCSTCCYWFALYKSKNTIDIKDSVRADNKT